MSNYILQVENSFGVIPAYLLGPANNWHDQEFIIKNGSNTNSPSQVNLSSGDYIDNSQPGYVTIQPLGALRVISMKDTRDNIWKWWTA